MPFWSSALDHLLDDSGFETPRPNPFPPLGSGKKPRPSLLAVPDFTPPPPTPSPIYLFQLPAKHAAKPAWDPNPGRKRRPKVWDMMPDPPRAAEPQQHLVEPAAYGQKSYSSWSLLAESQGQKVAAPPLNPQNGTAVNGKNMARQVTCSSNLDTMAVAGKPSPTSAGMLQGVMCLEGAGYPSRRYREGFHCGVDVSALWNVLLEFVFSPSNDKALPCCGSQHAHNRVLQASGAQQCSRPLGSVGCTVDEEEVTVRPDRYAAAAQQPALVQQKLQAQVPITKGPLHPLRQQLPAGKGIYSSPMSVLTPLSAEKSSTGSSPETQPHALLAFVGRDCSP